jgi:hypothetical protein
MIANLAAATFMASCSAGSASNSTGRNVSEEKGARLTPESQGTTCISIL